MRLTANCQVLICHGPSLGKPQIPTPLTFPTTDWHHLIPSLPLLIHASIRDVCWEASQSGPRPKPLVHTGGYFSVSFVYILSNSGKQFSNSLCYEWWFLKWHRQLPLKNLVKSLCGDLKLAMWQRSSYPYLPQTSEAKPQFPLTTAHCLSHDHSPVMTCTLMKEEELNHFHWEKKSLQVGWWDG